MGIKDREKREMGILFGENKIQVFCHVFWELKKTKKARKVKEIGTM